MADISITKYKTKVTKPTASPSNPGYPTSDPIDPVNPPASGAGGGGVNTFLQLTDTPALYTGQGAKAVSVKSDETGLEFIDFPTVTGGDEPAVKTTATADQTLPSGVLTILDYDSTLTNNATLIYSVGTDGRITVSDNGVFDITAGVVIEADALTALESAFLGIFRNGNLIAISSINTTIAAGASSGLSCSTQIALLSGDIIDCRALVTSVGGVAPGLARRLGTLLGANATQVNSLAIVKCISNGQSFLQLSDTPASYTGQAGLFPRVNSGETGLEFASAIGGTIASGQVAFGTGTGTIGGDSGLVWNNTTKTLTIDTINIGLGGGRISTNTRIGVSALASNTTGANNYAIGWSSLLANTTGSNNFGLGFVALALLSSGSNNVAIGNRAGRYFLNTSNNLTTSNNSIFIGTDAWANGNSETNQIVIGHQAIGGGSNTTVIGNSSTVSTRLYGTLRVDTINNATGDFVTASATGVLQKRTAAEVVSDLGIGGGFTERESDTILFDNNYITGNTSPRTGNILFDFTNAKLGAETRMIHNSSTVPTFPSTGIRLLGSYSINVNNYLWFRLTKSSSTQIVEIKIFQDIREFVESLIGSGVSLTNRYVFGATDGTNAYFAPHNDTQVLKITSSTDSSSLVGSVLSSGGTKYAGAAHFSGFIYFIPCSATSVLKLNVSTDTTTTFGTISGSTKYWGGKLSSVNSMIYCTPFVATNVGKIDPSTDTFSSFGSLGSGAKWAGMDEASSGNLYCAPYNDTQVLKIDPSTDTATRIGTSYSGSAQWGDIVSHPNGKLYCIPFGRNQFLEIDPSTDTTSLVGNTDTKSLGSAKVVGDWIVCSPLGSNNVYVFNPVTLEEYFLNFLNLTGTNRFWSSVLIGNKIYMGAYNYTISDAIKVLTNV